jgi:hypothetical protein
MTSLLCAGALLLTAAACSSDDDKASTSDTAAVTSTTSTSTTAPEPGGPKDITKVAGEAPLEPGSYFKDPDDDPSTPLRAVFEVAKEGWENFAGPVKFTPAGHTALSIITVDNIATEACHDPSPLEPAVGPTVDDLATALSTLAPFELTEAPTDVTLLGYEGKHLKITVPPLKVSGSGESAEYADCVNGNMHSWIDSSGEPFFGYNAEPGRYDEYWILDVDGTRVVLALNASPTSSAEDLADLQAIIDSITFES